MPIKNRITILSCKQEFNPSFVRQCLDFPGEFVHPIKFREIQLSILLRIYQNAKYIYQVKKKKTCSLDDYGICDILNDPKQES